MTEIRKCNCEARGVDARGVDARGHDMDCAIYIRPLSFFKPGSTEMLTINGKSYRRGMAAKGDISDPSISDFEPQTVVMRSIDGKSFISGEMIEDTTANIPQELNDLHAKAILMLEGIVADYGVTFEQASQIAQKITDYHKPLWDKQLLTREVEIIKAVMKLETHARQDAGIEYAMAPERDTKFISRTDVLAIISKRVLKNE